MKVSIITVCFNSEKTIEATINSVSNQTYSNIEYLVIDGKSKDNTLKIINRNKHIIDHVLSEPDNGLYDAMNKGISLATGDIIGILNSDDIFFNNKVIEEIVNFHKIKNNIQASIGNIVQYNSQKKIVRKYFSHNWNPQKLKIGFMPPHPSIFIRSEIFNSNKLYRLDFEIGADYELIVRYFLKEKISWSYSNITTTKMLIGGKSTSGLFSYLKITKEIKKALSLNEISYNQLNINLRFIWKIRDLIK